MGAPIGISLFVLFFESFKSVFLEAGQCFSTYITKLTFNYQKKKKKIRTTHLVFLGKSRKEVPKLLTHEDAYSSEGSKSALHLTTDTIFLFYDH